MMVMMMVIIIVVIFFFSVYFVEVYKFNYGYFGSIIFMEVGFDDMKVFFRMIVYFSSDRVKQFFYRFFVLQVVENYMM